MEQTLTLQFVADTTQDLDSAAKQRIKDMLLASLQRNLSSLPEADRALAKALLIGPYTPMCGVGVCELPAGHEGGHWSKW